MSELQAIYQKLQEKPSTSSGRGISYWAKAMHCGRLANLSEQRKLDLALEDQTEALHSERVIGKIAGGYFHALQEAWHSGRLSGPFEDDCSEFDIHFHEAVRCFKVYQKFWHKEYFGKTLGCEITFPRNEVEAAWLKEQFGQDFTFRVDRLIELSEADMVLINITRNAELASPGRYILDYKLLYSTQGKDTWEYTEGLQALAYPTVYNMLHEKFDYGAPVNGMIFDVTTRSTRLEANWGTKNFALYVARPNPWLPAMLSSAMLQAAANVEANRANPFNCVGPYGPCPFLKDGSCNRQ